MEEDIYIAFFESKDFAGKIITMFEKFFFPNLNRIYTHVGVVIKSKLIEDIIPCYKGFKYVILESTMSGKLNDGIKNTCKETYLGVQLRNFDELVEKYKADKKKLSVSTINNLPHNYQIILREFIHKYINRNYDTTIINLITIHYPFPCVNTSGIFCSDLICRLLQDLSVICNDIEPKKVSPNTLFTLVKGSISCPMYISY